MQNNEKSYEGTSNNFYLLSYFMGNILSRKNTYDVTTYEGWDKKMQEIAEVELLH